MTKYSVSGVSKKLFENRYSLDSLENLQGDSLCISPAIEPDTPTIKLYLTMEVTVSRGVTNHKNLSKEV